MKTIQQKFTFWAAACLLVTVVTVIAYAALTLRNIAQTAREEAIATAQHLAGETAEKFSGNIKAGAGFAVVADEVRNLAMRAAEAAQNTANLIEGTVKKVAAGSGLVSKTNEAFVQMTGSTRKVGDLVGEISAASSEQAQGIEQINQAVTEMGKVVQQNAASAEESASVSQEMKLQVDQMKSAIGKLTELVGRTGRAKSLSKERLPANQAISSSRQKTETRKQAPSVTEKKEVDPSQVIPLDDDFADF